MNNAFIAVSLINSFERALCLVKNIFYDDTFWIKNYTTVVLVVKKFE